MSGRAHQAHLNDPTLVKPILYADGRPDRAITWLGPEDARPRRVRGCSVVDTETAYDVWRSLSWLFVDENDDDRLPEVQIHGIPTATAGRLWDRLLRGAEIAAPDATVFVTAEGRDVPARGVPDLAGRAERGEVSMHVVLSQVSAGGVGVPDLGISIHEGELDIDYPVNVWSPSTAIAFLWLLAELQALAPGSRLVAADEAGTAYDAPTQAKLASAIKLLSLAG